MCRYIYKLGSTASFPEIVLTDNKILFYIKTGGDKQIGVLFINNVVKFVGYFTTNLNPSIGLAINVPPKSTGNFAYLEYIDLVALPELLRRLMKIDYLLELLEFKSIDDLQSGQKLEKQPNGVSIYILNCQADLFEMCIECYLFELCEELTLVSTNLFTYFIGECKEINCTYREHCGFKAVGPNVFCGELPLVLTKDLPVTYGSLKLTDRRYKGLTSGGEPNGMGHVSYNNENQFVGCSCRGLMSYGCFFHDLKHYIVSVWERRDRVGYTIEQYGDGVVYFGQISQGKKNGLGVIMMANVSMIMGSWEDNKVHGMILSFSHVATVFSGNVSNESFNGYGEMFYKNRSCYYGDWDCGQYHGLGKLVDQDKPQGDNKVRLWNHGMIMKSHRSYAKNSEESSNSQRMMDRSRNPYDQQQTL